MWKQPYSLKEGSAIAAGLIVTGLMLQLSMGPLDWDIFVWPANIVVLTILVFLTIVAYALRSRHYFFRFMTTWQCAVPAIAAAVVLTLIMGLTAQVAPNRKPADPLGLTKMLSFWPFILVYVWMTAIVGQEAVWQVMHWSRRRWPSLLSHVGLFVVLTCGTLGSADMQRLKMYCEQGRPEWRGLDAWNNVHELPVAIELEKFSIDEYPPKLMIVDASGRPLPADKPQTLTVDTAFKGGSLQGWTVSIERQIDDAIPSGTTYVHSDRPGAVCALLVKASSGRTVRRGWVTCGSYRYAMQGLPVGHGLTIVMGQREPKRYYSVADIYTKDGKNLRATVEVNHPVSVSGWKIYQYSYNEAMGKWSTLSVFELVRDPWLPVVYTGILLLAAGAIGMLLIKR